MPCLIGILLLLLSSSGAATQDGSIVTEDFRVEITPAIVPAEHYPDASPPYYLWPFEARVINELDIPVRIVEFGSMSWRAGEWLPVGAAYGATEFTDWYTDGDPVEDGWIQPGATAVDARSWNRSGDAGPTIGRAKWFYRAIDADQREYLAEVEPEFVPHEPPIQNWKGREESRTTRLAINITGEDGEVLHQAQVRFGRYPGGTRAFAIYHGGEVEADLPVPGLYWLDVYAPGHNWVGVPLVLMDEPADAMLMLRMRGHESLQEPEFIFEGVGDAAARAIEFYREWKPSRDEYYAAMVTYREAHMTYEGFEHDAPAGTERLAGMVANDAEPELARFAVILFLNSPSVDPQPANERIQELLPSDSVIWAFSPMAASNATGRAKDRRLAMQEFADSNPDPAVRARNLINLGYGARYDGDVQRLTSIVETLRDGYADLDLVQWQVNDLERAELLVKGRPMPEFDLQTLEDGVRVASSDMRGSYYLLHFWATWCGPCMAEMEFVHAANEEFANSGLEVVSVSMDRKREAITRLRENRWPMPWANVYWKDDPGFDERFGISSIPALFLVDPDGVIVASGPELRGDELRETLVEFLGGTVAESAD